MSGQLPLDSDPWLDWYRHLGDEQQLALDIFSENLRRNYLGLTNNLKHLLWDSLPFEERRVWLELSTTAVTMATSPRCKAIFENTTAYGPQGPPKK